MLSGTLQKKTAVPWWAAFGAPLIGVPVLVALLALGSAGHGDAGLGSGVESGYVTEQAEALQAAVDAPPVSFEDRAESRI